jgi:type I restriction enzyme S subunit
MNVREIPAKYLYRVVDKRAGVMADEVPLLAVSQFRGVIRRDEISDKEARADDLTNYKLCAAEDIVINRMSAYQGALGISPIAGLISPDYLILRVRRGIEPRFLTYLFRSTWFVGEITARLRGIGTTGQGNVRTPRINEQDLGRIRIAVPDFPVQQAIADYLDRETSRIDALSAAKRRMMELLDERRRALRDHAFDSKPGWRLKRLLANSMAYGVLVPEFVEVGTGVPMIRTYNLSSRGSVNHEDIAEIPAGLAMEYRRTSLSEGNLILSVVGSMGRSAVVSVQEQGYNLNRPLARLQLRQDVSPRLIWHWTQTAHFMDMAKLATGGGTAQPTLNLGDLANFTVGLPLETRLWPHILATLEKACGRLDVTEDALGRQLGLLQERRQAIITAAVTGQFDIPETA